MTAIVYLKEIYTTQEEISFTGKQSIKKILEDHWEEHLNHRKISIIRKFRTKLFCTKFITLIDDKNLR